MTTPTTDRMMPPKKTTAANTTAKNDNQNNATKPTCTIKAIHLNFAPILIILFVTLTLFIHISWR